MSTSLGMIYVVALLVIIALHSADALRCYSCSFVAPGSDKSCVNNPDAVIGQKIINCSKKYCIIERKELLDTPGSVNTFLRGCQDKPLYLNDVIRDSTFKTYYRSCTKDLCNSGDGISSSNSAFDPDAGAGENMIVKGKGAGNSVRYNLNLIFALFISVIVFLK